DRAGAAVLFSTAAAVAGAADVQVRSGHTGGSRGDHAAVERQSAAEVRAGGRTTGDLNGDNREGRLRTYRRVRRPVHPGDDGGEPLQLSVQPPRRRRGAG